MPREMDIIVEGCKSIGGRLRLTPTRCVREVEFTNVRNEKIQRIVEVTPIKDRFSTIVTEGSRWDSGFDTHIVVYSLRDAFKLAKEIINAEGNPEKMHEIATERLSDYEARVLDWGEDKDKELLEQL